MVKQRDLLSNEEIIESDVENLEDAIEIAKMNLPEGSQLYLITDGPDGEEMLLPIDVEKKDEN